MRPSMVALLSAALLLCGVWAVRDTASARETVWWMEEDVGPASDAVPEPLDEFQAAIPAETGSLRSGDVSETGSGEGTGPSSGGSVDPDE